MADLIRGTTPSYIVDFTDSGVNVADITKATLTAKYRCVKTDLSDVVLTIKHEQTDIIS